MNKVNKSLPDLIRIEHDIIQQSDSLKAVLCRLPRFLEVVRFSKKTASLISRFEKKIIQDDMDHRKKCRDGLEWMKDCLGKLMESRFSGHSLVKERLKHAELVILHSAIDQNSFIGWDEGLLDVALRSLSSAASMIASFGDDQLFKGWAKVGHRSVCLECCVPETLKKTRGRVKKSIKSRCEMAEEIGHGIETWEILPPGVGIDETLNKDTHPYRIHCRAGTLQELMLPTELADLLNDKSNDGIERWTTLRDSDHYTLYQYLNLLAQYNSFEPATLPPKIDGENRIEPKPWEDFGRFNSQAVTGDYLSRFDSSKPPIDLGDLKKLVVLFINMLTSELLNGELIKGRSGDIKLREEAKAFCVEEIVDHVAS
ncbi:hypothetical protein LCGC14_1027900, partial [marine sediment metagenome]